MHWFDRVPSSRQFIDNYNCSCWSVNKQILIRRNNNKVVDYHGFCRNKNFLRFFSNRFKILSAQENCTICWYFSIKLVIDELRFKLVFLVSCFFFKNSNESARNVLLSLIIDKRSSNVRSKQKLRQRKSFDSTNYSDQQTCERPERIIDG